ncbi:MAG: autotransporter outer membrane beta-barrel domain-containing protein [Kiloniellales bacterium]
MACKFGFFQPMLLGLGAASLFLQVGATPAQAACTQQSNLTYICEGTLDDIKIFDVFDPEAAVTVKAQNLDASVGKTFTAGALGFDAQGNGNRGSDAGTVTVTFDGVPHGIFFSSQDSGDFKGLNAISNAGDGSSGDHSTVGGGTARSDPGGDGGNGGAVTLSVDAGINSGGILITSNESGQAILGQSRGGDAGPSDEAKVDTGGEAYGGVGGVGGNAGPVTIDVKAVGISYEGGFVGNQTANGIVASATGGRGGDGAEAKVEAAGPTHGGDGNSGGTGGAVSINIESATIGNTAPMGSTIIAESFGGDGGDGGEARSEGAGASNAGDAGSGGLSTSASLVLGNGMIIVGSSGGNGDDVITPVVRVHAQGGNGGVGGDAFTGGFGDSNGGNGGNGGAGGAASLVLGPAQVILEQSSGGVFVQSFGGTGGSGGEAQTDFADERSDGGNAGDGGASGSIKVTPGAGAATITVEQGDPAFAEQHALVLQTIAGDGGDGGNASSETFGDATGGNGGQGGTAGSIDADILAEILTRGGFSQGLVARSYGGAGGNGGNAEATTGSGQGGAGKGSGPGGEVSVQYQGTVQTFGRDANGMLIQSIGGFSGDGGGASGFEAFGAGSQSAGDGGVVTTSLGDQVTITTSAVRAYALQVQSIGGGGGRGGTGDGIASLGGSGSAGGGGADVTVEIGEGAEITTSGTLARAVHVLSVGGGGGDGGGSTGVVALGGSAGSGGSGSNVVLSLDEKATVSTAGNIATGLYAASIGGGGGSAHSTQGIESIGGSGGDGGSGGPVTINNAGTISTEGADADAVAAQSVGGGGGKGSNATSVSAGFSLAIGGSGGNGGFANNVTYNDTGAAGRKITTEGDRSRGIFLQSVGGGGGDGGNAVSASAGGPVNLSLGFSGDGGGGGRGGIAQYQTGAADVATAGDHSVAIQVQSVGGGGGNAGTDVTASGPSGVNLSLAMGGSGGSGGKADFASVESNSSLSTKGDHASAVLIQSIGGGGGNAGTTINGDLGGPVSLGGAIGGSGGSGGAGGEANANGGGGISTEGDHSFGLLAQSIGGGGGNGGTTVAASGVSEVSANVAIGGQGGDGGNSDLVTVKWADAIMTQGNNASAVMVQSIGGGGGNAGTTVAGAASSRYSLTAAVGGNGGGGGDAEHVGVTLLGPVTTKGEIAHGLQVQSIGGGGGHSGTTISGTAISNMSADLSVGGSGGSAGNAMRVEASTADVTTEGNSSSAVSALSIGGGGGDAHFTGAFSGNSTDSVNLSIGGSGGAAGDGGEVAVSLTGDLATAGHNAAGVRAMSIGGGGGDSGMTVSGSLEGSVPINVSVGGSGGSAGSGGAVSVTGQAGTSIQTKGANSEGILAASIAGSGGSSGHVMAGSAISGGTAGVAIGGKGGSGGNAGSVTVGNAASIATQGAQSSAIEARSIAGGGGSAKGSITASALSMGDASLTIGGDGGDGGMAGATAVTSSGAITTESHHAYGILGQSIGGSGGNGGFAAQASFTGGEVSGQASVSIGGSGGDGGSAGTTKITNEGSISTADFGAHGILAQSIGGSGGSGGNVYSGNFSASSDASANVTLNIGGTGGDGAVGGAVTVDNTASIETDGFLADGIAAQSIGGNGGSGGSTYSVLTTVSEGSSASVTVDIGGAGGSGQNAATTEVKNSATIATTKGGSNAILAMSIGGGGGRGGAAANLNIEPLPSASAAPGAGAQSPGEDDDSSLSASVDFGVGGKGGAAGNGGKVDVTNDAMLLTAGKSSKAIYAMSVGGGGGEGGAASSASFSFDGICSALSGGAGFACKPEDGGDDDTTDISASLTAEVGGKGGAAGDGESVTVTNSGDIETSGRLGHGIVAHSIGGGGGTGGEGGLGIQAWTNNETANSIANLPANFNFIPNFNDVSMAIGGSGGASGTGGSVSVQNTAAITTAGDFAFAIHAQSIGGGGGNGGAGSTGLWSELTVGGRGSGGGNGGAVTVSQESIITTNGEGSIGIFAQSVGGGGGTAGDVYKAFSNSWLDLNIGAGLGVQEAAGGGGDGGDITVMAGDIATSGVGAHGIVAQSVGGSGGIAQISGDLGSLSKLNTYAGGAGDGGNGGAIDITVGGSILVSGKGAQGVVAQSSTGRLGSQDASGDVTITVQDDIIASGEGGRAILAQSDGAIRGTIAITVEEDAAVVTSADGAETIGLFHGSGNSLTNNGLIQHQGSAADDYVLRTNGFGLTVQNNGAIAGSVLSQSSQANGPPGGPIIITNAQNASFGLGATMNLGQGGALDNAGTVSPGTVGSIGTSVFQGGFTQDSGGTLHIDFNLAGENDRISFVQSSSPALAGQVEPALQGSLPKSGDKGSFVILSSEAGYRSNDLMVESTSTVDYSLTRQSNDISLGYAVDFTPWNGDAAAQAKVTPATREIINANHTNFGDSIDLLVTRRNEAEASGTDDLSFVDDLTGLLLETGDVGDLVDIYDRFAPGEIFAPSDAALFSSLRFADSLNSCPLQGAEGQVVFTQQGSCLWLQASGGGIDRQRTGDSIDYDETLFGFSLGGQTAFGEGYFAGLAFGYEDSNLSNSRFSGEGSRFQGGVSIKKEIQDTTLSASFSGGVGSYDLTRNVITPSGTMTADSSPNSNWISGHARVAQIIDLNEALYFKPWFDIGIDHQWQGDYDESGAGDYGLAVAGFSQTLVTLNPMLELGGGFQLFGAQVNATAEAGLLAVVSGRDRSTDVSLLGSGSGGPSYLVSDEARPLFADIGASVDIVVHERAVISFGGQALLAGNQQEYGGTGRLSIFF